MRNLKKVLSLALCLVMLLGMMVVGAGAAEYTDAKDITKTEAVDVMSALKILEGSNGSFNPKGDLKRSEAAKIMVYVADGPVVANALSKTETKFDDVASSHWASGFVAYCSDLGIIAGSNGKFRPSDPLKVQEFAKMLLVAMGGDEASYTGSGWATNVQRDAIKAKLNENVGITLWSAPVTREQAAQMAFNALTGNLEGPKTVYVVGTGATAVEFDNMKDAALYAAVKNADVATKTDTTGTLGEKNYGLKQEATTDSFGRTTTTWTANGGVKVVVNRSTPVKTYTGRVKASEIYKDLGLTKDITVNKDKDCKDTWHLNGINFQWSEPTVSNPKDPNHPGGDHNKYANYVCMSGVISKNSDFSLANNMSTTEVYYDGTNVRIVTWDNYVGEVTKVTPANEKKDIKRSINVKVFGLGTATVETEDYEKGDYVLVTTNETGKGCSACYAPFEGDNFKIVGPATVIENVSVTGYKSGVTANSSVTFDGETYKYSSQAIAAQADGGVSSKPALTSYTIGDKASYTFVLDANGNVAVSKAYSVETEVQYAVVLNYGVVTTGSSLNAKTYEAQLLFTDGTTKVVKMNKFDGKTVSESAGDGKIQYTTLNVDDNKNIFVTYTEDDGVYALTKVPTTGTNVPVSAAIGASDSKVAVTGNKAAYTTGRIANNKTVFLAKIGDDYKVFTGIANLPSMTSSNTAYGQAVSVGGIDSYVFLIAPSTDSSVSTAQYAYIFDKTSPSVTANGSEFDVVVGGEKTTLATKEDSVVTAVGSLDFGTGVVSGLVSYKTANGQLISDDLAVAAGKTISNLTGDVMILSAAVNGSASWQLNDKTVVYVIENGDVSVETMDFITADEEGKIFVEKVANTDDVAAVVWIMR